MYLPSLYRSEDLNFLKNLIGENPLGSLITFKEKVLCTKAIIQINELTKDLFVLKTHLNKVNPIAKSLNVGDEILCDFLGVHSYISSSWYDHVNVSTWNYEEVQIYGTVEIMNDNELFHHLKKLTDGFEIHQQCPMTFEKMGAEYVYKEMKGTIGFKITPTEIKIKQKFSQNRDDKNYQQIIDNLNKSHSTNDKKMAEKMADLRKSNGCFGDDHIII